MQHGKDLVGQRFGRLVAVRPTEERKWNSVVWECLCDCGNTTYVCSRNLVSGGTQSCGCLKKETLMHIMKGQRIHDIAGQRFGKLIAIRPTAERRNRSVVWECLCDCGNTAYVSSHQLLRGGTQSCGCLHQKKVSRDLTDQRFGKLIAVQPTEERRGGYIVWECLCDCKNTTYVSSNQLLNGGRKSCGCLHKKKSNCDFTSQ